MQDLVITTQGKALITKLIAGATKATFTKCATSAKVYTQAECEGLTALADIRQEKAIDSMYLSSDSLMIEAYVKFDNTLVTSGYNIQTVGIYAQETGGSEILYAVSLADTNVDYMPAYDGHNPTAITFRLNVRVENNANVEITIDPAGTASNENLKALEDKLTQNITTINTNLSTTITQEQADRKSGDKTLTDNLAKETAERKNADTTLQNNINAEKTARENADNAISAKVDPMKTLIDTVFLNGQGSASTTLAQNTEIKPVYFGNVHFPEVGSGQPSAFDSKWIKEATKTLYTRLKKAGYSRRCVVQGLFQPATSHWVMGLFFMSVEGTVYEDAQGYPTFCQFIAQSYGGRNMYSFGANNGIWYFDTLPLTSTVNTLISNAKTALETAYKNADTSLSNNLTTAYKNADSAITTAYKEADKTNFNTLTTNYTNADSTITSAYKAADTSNFNTLTTNYKAADKVINDALTKEQADRASGDTNLQSQINTVSGNLSNIAIAGSPCIVLSDSFMVTGGNGGKGVWDGINETRNAFVSKYLTDKTKSDLRSYIFQSHIANVGICTVFAQIYNTQNDTDRSESYKFIVGGGASLSGSEITLSTDTGVNGWKRQMTRDNNWYRYDWVQGSENQSLLNFLKNWGLLSGGVCGCFNDSPAGIGQLYNFSFKGHWTIEPTATDYYFTLVRVTVTATVASTTQVSGQVLGATYVREIYNNAWNGAWRNIG